MGDNVVLQYSDNTSDQADMSLVTLSFTYQTTGISQIEDKESIARKGFINLRASVWCFFPPGFCLRVFILLMVRK